MPSPQTRTLKLGPQFRTLTIERRSVDEDNRTIPLAFSSETPVERWWGYEILDHSPGAVRMGRLQSGAPLLCDHDRMCQVGKVEGSRIDKDRMGRADVRFSKSNPRAEQEYQDVLDEIRSKVSVGYIIHEIVLESEKDGVPTYRVTDWEPFEISLVSVEADTTVGVGRSTELGEREIVIKTKEMEVRTMPHTVPTPTPAAPAVDAAAIRAEAERSAQTRVTEILSIAQRRPELMDMAREFISSGKSVDEFRAAVMERLFEAKPVTVSAEIGLTDKEARSFSLMRAINALANPTEVKFREAAAFEFECSRAVATNLRKEPQGFFLPMDVQQRDLTKGVLADGGYSVQTSVLGGSFIELLRNKLCLEQMGATTLTGLVGDIAIPSQAGAAQSYWLAENTAPTESQQILGQVTLTPKTVGAFTDISRKLLLQSSIDVEQLVRNDLAAVIALAIDYAGINGTGTGNQPKGILNTSGIGSVAGGTNGAAPTWANIIALETAVAVVNADVGKLGYCTNTKVRGTLKTTQKATYLPFIWENGDAPGEGLVNGYRACATNQVPATLTKGTSAGVCSALIFGNFADWIIALWGALDILVDPYTGGAAGTVRVRMLQDVDEAPRRVASFAAMVDALTP